MHGQPINIALAFDDAYAPHGAVVIASAVRFLPPGSARFLCLHDGLSEQRKQDVAAAAPGFEFVWREVKAEEMPDLPEKGYLNRITLFRLGLSKFAPADWSRVIYLDSDMVVEADLRPLWDMNLDGLPIGAVRDVYQDSEALAGQFSLPPAMEDGYFNAGMLVIDLDAERQSQDLASCLSLLIKQNFDLEFLDQDALNVIYWNRWKPLNLAWNVQRYLPGSDPLRKLWEPHKQPAIIHYITSDKPWKRDVWHPWAGAYWRVLQTTRFADEVIARYGAGWSDRLRINLRYWLSQVR